MFLALLLDLESHNVHAMNRSTEQIAVSLGEQLSALNWQITVAESCTGGGIGAALTSVAGSSVWFEAGFITYSNRVKTALLGVPDGVFEKHGAVSSECVQSMLEGALRVSSADFGLAVSGIAGPGGGSSEKPVGTVYLAWGTLDQPQTKKYFFSGGRAQVREQAVSMALLNAESFLKNKNTV